MKVDVELPNEQEKGKATIHVSPFKKATTVKKRLKLFLWGDSGVGKTTLSLQFPGPVVIDLEGGADLYGDAFKFDVLRAANPDDVMSAVDWLLANKHPYRTLIIDPVTVYWDSLQKKWSDIFLRRNKGSKGHKYEFYDLQPKDWMTVKAEFKELIRKLIALDMNVIVTAREKTKYKEGSFMVSIGETFDGEKSLPYMFDTIVQLYIDEQGRHMGLSLKDRSHKLPKDEFDCSYENLEKLFGKEYLDREATPVKYATDDQKETISGYIEQFGMAPEQVTKRLSAYGATSLDDLTINNANIIISKFESAIAEKGSEQNEKQEGNNNASN